MHCLRMRVWIRMIYFPQLKEIVHNAQSLSKHIDDIISDDRIIDNDILGFTETKIKLSD